MLEDTNPNSSHNVGATLHTSQFIVPPLSPLLPFHDAHSPRNGKLEYPKPPADPSRFPLRLSHGESEGLK